MSRSGYSDDSDGWELIRWRGAVQSAIRGKRGQQFLRDLVAALDTMLTKRLIAGSLEQDGEVCALGSVGKMRGISMEALDPYDSDAVAALFGIARAMAKEIMYENDDDFACRRERETPEQRWGRLRAWALSNIQEAQP